MILIREFQPNTEKGIQFRKALIVTVVGNIFLALLKGTAAYFSESAALYSDAINSISDVVYSVFLIIGLSISQKPPDHSHPQGHDRFEPLMGLIITISMTLAGVEAMRSSISRFISGGAEISLGIPTIALLVSALSKTSMFLIIRSIARKIVSPGLDAAAKDNLSDILTSMAALIGIIGSKYIHPVLDPIAGILVSVWIFRAALSVGKENLSFLTGGSPDEEIKDKILDVAKTVPGVVDVHQMVTEYVGPKIVVDMHIDIDQNINLQQAHEISDRVAEALLAIPEVDRAYIHPEPIDPHK
ncbi:MAG: cation transporter [Anaerolineaceae bacterium]|jgi:cation diffusion facilitator family transporter|nr:MAG: cation transporter [Anaerolineaceae bacterium]